MRCRIGFSVVSLALLGGLALPDILRGKTRAIVNVSRHNQGDEHGDDGNHHQEFNEGEAAASQLRSLAGASREHLISPSGPVRQETGLAAEVPRVSLARDVTIADSMIQTGPDLKPNSGSKTLFSPIC